MWAILFVGGGLLAATGLFVARPDRRRIPFLGALALSTALATLYGLVIDLAAVCGYLAGKEGMSGDEFARTLAQGLKESSRPVSFGLVVLTMASLLFAAGLARMSPAARAEKAEA
ncbi:MAG: hypothetical protein R3B70_30085 [Polyangiaceae bacterium]